MTSIESLRAKLEERINGDAMVLQGILMEVDREERSCVLEEEGVKYYGIALQGVTDSEKGVVIYPAEGAVGVAIRVSDGHYALVGCSEAEGLDVKIGETRIEVDAAGIKLNGGMNGSLVNVDVLKSWMANVTGDIGRIAVALGAIPVTMVPVTVMPGRELEDEKIKH